MRGRARTLEGRRGAAGTFKGGFAFHPLLAYLDDSHEPLAGVLRPGNAGANTTAHHIDIVELVLEQLPREIVVTAQIIIRTDSAAATHELCDELRAGQINFLMGYDLTESVRAAIVALPEAAWRPAIRQDGEIRQAPGWPRSPTASRWPAGPTPPG